MSRCLSLIAAVVLAGCADDWCQAPDTTQYSRPPITDNGPGCDGGPVWTSVHGDHETHHDDPTLRFSVGTTARLPECDCCYSSGRSFVCVANNGSYVWGSSGL
jgi:hypothetical protein